jgi:hypothetical protein
VKRKTEMSTRVIKPLSILAVTIALTSLVIAPAIALPLQLAGNLLRDSSFEGALSGDWQWQFWDYEAIVFQDGTKIPDPNRSFYAPSFLPSEPKWDQESNGTVGTAGAVSSQYWKKFRGGFYQTVDVVPGTCVRFSVWANEFCQTDGSQSCPILLEAGIDPNGGTDWTSDNIWWVSTAISNSSYVLLIVPEVAVGQTGKVTVFTWGEPLYPVPYGTAYFDEASLVTCRQTIFLPIILLKSITDAEVER